VPHLLSGLTIFRPTYEEVRINDHHRSILTEVCMFWACESHGRFAGKKIQEEPRQREKRLNVERARAERIVNNFMVLFDCYRIEQSDLDGLIVKDVENSVCGGSFHGKLCCRYK